MSAGERTRTSKGFHPTGPKPAASASSATPACLQGYGGLAPHRGGDGGAVETDHLGTDPESQAARGLTPDEQRAERERESRESDETKFEQAVEDDQAEREKLVQRIGQPLEPRDDE
jgi:hypothetical protein